MEPVYSVVRLEYDSADPLVRALATVRVQLRGAADSAACAWLDLVIPVTAMRTSASEPVDAVALAAARALLDARSVHRLLQQELAFRQAAVEAPD